jgi:hypothetical protein
VLTVISMTGLCSFGVSLDDVVVATPPDSSASRVSDGRSDAGQDETGRRLESVMA